MAYSPGFAKRFWSQANAITIGDLERFIDIYILLFGENADGNVAIRFPGRIEQHIRDCLKKYYVAWGWTAEWALDDRTFILRQPEGNPDGLGHA